MNLIHKLRCAIDEPYRIRHGFGLSPLRNKGELRALIDFCKEELKDKEHMKLNVQRRDIYKETIYLYNLMAKNDSPKKGYYFAGKRYMTLMEFVEDYIGWYWN